MKIKKAIEKARKKRKQIRNTELAMMNQSAKSLIYWIFIDSKSDKEALERVASYLKSDKWVLDNSKFGK